MKTRNTLFALALCTLTAFSAGIGPTGARPVVPIKKTPPAQRQKFDISRFVPESELHAGQMGYALTVFKGTKIERFGVEILGVLSKVNNGKDLILIRVTSGPSVSRQANIAAGMSGSPVYIGHRMVGAIAYSLPFAREPIGLVTPIGDMLDAWDPDLPSKPSMALAATAAAQIGTPMNPAVTVDNTALAPYLGQVAGQSAGYGGQGTTTFEPVMTPVMVSGETTQGIAQLSSILGPLHLMPMAGGGPPAHISEAEKRSAELVPGAAVGVSLVQGDIDETAIGTLTYRDGDRVIAFGHPFTGIGPIDAALTTASITDLFPSYQDSTKLGSPLETVGRIFQDRPFSVGGIIGSMPHMIPVSIEIQDDSDNRTTYFHARVINHPLLTGPLISQVADQAILEAHGTPGDAIAMVTTTVDAEQVGTIVRKNIFYDPLSIDQSAVGDLDNAMRMLSSNPFYPLAVKSVQMSVKIESKHPTAQIDHIILPKASYAPGDTVNVGVVLKPYRRPNTLVTVPLVIPTTAPDGPVTVMVRGGASSGATSISLGGTTLVLKPAIPVGPPAANISQLVHQYLEEPRNNDLVASLQLPSTALDVQGEKLSLLPPTMSAVMRSEHSSGLKVERDEIKKTLPMQWIISGQQSLTINVAHKDTTDTGLSGNTPGSATGGADSTPPAPPAQAADDSSDDSGDVSSADNSSDGGDNSGDNSGDGGDGDDGDGSPVLATSGSWTGELMKMMLAPGALVPVPASVVHHSLPKSPIAPSQDTTESTAPSTPAQSAPLAQSPPEAVKPTPVGRVASIWRQDSAAAFGEGTLNDVIISSDNDLRLSASLSPLASSTAPYIWSMVSDGKGNLFAGTGDDGVIFRVSGSAMEPYYHTGQIEVSSLAYDAKTGDLYAGTAGHGAIFRISPDGHGTQIYTTAEKYVTALALDSKAGRLYAATGGGIGNVYAIPLAAPSTGKVLFASPEAHLQSLAVGPDGTIYAGGSPDGLVYQITPDGKGSILYDAAEPNITSLAVDSSGTVYAGTSPRGVVYKIVPAGSGAPTVKKIIPAAGGDDSGNPIYSLAVDGSGNVWACSGNDILRAPQDGSVLAYAGPTDVSFISLALAPGGVVYAGTSNIGTVYAMGTAVRLSSGPLSANGTYTSPVHDAKLPSRWGTITWQAICPAGSSIQLQTRSGDVAKPDSTWSDWSAPYTVSAGEKIASPPARFIQYRATIIGDPMAQPTSLPRLQAVAIYYLTRNQPPSVKFVSPDGGDSLSGTVDLRWAGSDPDKDTLSYTILYSSDGGKSWQPIKKALQSSPAPAQQTKLTAVANTLQSQGITGASDADVAKAMVEFKKQLDQQTGIPPGVRQQMLAQAPDVIRQALLLKAGVPASAAADTNRVTATDYHWDTKTVADGTYQVKVIATDAPSNPTDALTAEAVSEPFVVDNTPPTLTIDPAKTAVDQQKRTVTLHGIATTGLSFVQAVQYKIDGSSDWSAAAPDSGLFDSRTAAFTIATAPLSAGAHTITVEAIDQAGNTAQATSQVMVP